MPVLHVLRHAKSSWDDTALDDRMRPLSDRGVRSARRMAAHLDEQGIRPGLVLCSSAVRTRQTLELVRPGMGEPGTLIEDGLYAAEVEQLLGRLRMLPTAVGSAMVIGHNPGLQELVLVLSAPSPAVAAVEAKFPTCALATLDSGAEPWTAFRPGGAELTGVITPRQLG
jgi:phosphohistidine phosphatase